MIPVQYLVDQNVISGYADGSFRPNENVTRAQFAKMLVLAAGWNVVTPATPSFNDVSSNYWAYGYIETAVSHGVISGYGDGSFRPGNPVTRGQVAKMIFIARGWTLELAHLHQFHRRTHGRLDVQLRAGDQLRRSNVGLPGQYIPPRSPRDPRPDRQDPDPQPLQRP